MRRKGTPASYLDQLVPEEVWTDRTLRRRLAADAERRLRAILRRWRGIARAQTASRLDGILPALRTDREQVLSDGRTRVWLAAAEDAVATEEAARRAARARGGSPEWSSLLDRIADLGALAAVAPRGSLTTGFPDRASRFARRILDELAAEIPDLRASPTRTTPLVVALQDSKGRRPGPAGAVALFGTRVGHAVALLRRAWPAAAEMVIAHVHRVVPIDEKGVVSFSSAREPGFAYINVRSTPLVRLAEDLLHEATHIRLHRIESLHPLVSRRRGEDEQEARFYSPWRREWRPIRGLLHGACTFTVGADFFAHMLAASEPGGGVRFSSSRRRWLARRLLEEMENTRLATETLWLAERRHLLRPAGKRILRAVIAARKRLVREASTRKRELRDTASGRVELRRFADYRRHLAAKPSRWGWDVSRTQE